MNKTIYKTTLNITIIISLLIGLLPTRVQAVAPDTTNCIINDSCFYSTAASEDEICDPVLGGAAGTGPLYGPLFPKVSDTKKLSEAIATYINNTKPNSPYNTTAFANMFVSKGIEYDVNPALAVAQLQIETSLATVGKALPPKYNAFNVRNGPGGSFGNYPGYAEALDAYYSLIKRVYTGPPSNITSVQDLINKYAPPSDGNNVSQYLTITNQIMTKILSGLGAETNPKTEEPEPTDSTSGCRP